MKRGGPLKRRTMLKSDPEKVRAWRSSPETIRAWQRAGLARVVAPSIPDDVLPDGPTKPSGDRLRRLGPHKRSRQPRPTNPGWKGTRARIIERDGGLCQRCGLSVVCTDEGVEHDFGHVHHVLPRSRGGKNDGSTPLLLVCGMCHEFIHGHPYESVEKGWLI